MIPWQRYAYIWHDQVVDSTKRLRFTMQHVNKHITMNSTLINLSHIHLPDFSSKDEHHHPDMYVHFNPKETFRGLLSPLAYDAYHCWSTRNHFPLKFYTFLKNIVLHNIMCETNSIVLRTQFNRFYNDTIDRNGAVMPGSILVLNSNDMTYFVRKCPKQRLYSIKASFLILGW